MTVIYLPAPQRRPGGPDGQGWNRLAVLADMCGDECALKPRSYAALWEIQNNRPATYGAYGHCAGGGACDCCPVLNATPRQLRAFTARVLARIDEQGGIWLMNRPEDGWGSYGERWTWDELARLKHWDLDGQYRDRDSAGFWLKYVEPRKP